MSTVNESHAVNCQFVEKYYGSNGTRVHALQNCNLQVRAGEILMLVGPSGCGKTTLLSVMVGILEIDGGNIEVFGQNISRMSANQKTLFRRDHVGFAFQQFNLLPTLSCVENAALPLLIGGMARNDALNRAAEMLSAMGIGDKLNVLPKQLSGGQQQRVAFSRALVHEPKLVVCDEPTSALDSRSGEMVMNLLRQKALRPDRAVIVVTHDSRIFHHADRIAQMEDGHITKVTQRGDPDHPVTQTVRL